MKTTLIDLYNGNIHPCGTCGVGNQEVKRLGELMDKNREELLRCLTEEQKGILEKYVSCVDEMNLLIYEECFVDGYRLGTRMTVEAFSED